MLIGKWRRPIVTPGGIARDEGAGDADVGLVAQQLVRIEHAEGETDDGRYRRKRDVALVEVEFEADDFAALPHAAANDAGVGDRGGVRARARPRQRETGYFLAARETREVVVLLLLRAVVIQQLGGAERVGYGDGGGGRGAAAGEFDQHAGVRVSGELQSAVLLRNDHGEEAARLHEVPHVRRHVAALVRDIPVIEHPAELFAGAVEEGLFFGRQRGRLSPIGASTTSARR